MLSESAEAKVLGRDEVGGSTFGGGSEGAGFAANGFAGVGAEEDENGFEGAAPVENGLIDEVLARGFVPKSDSPMWATTGFVCWLFSFDLVSLGFFSLATTSVTRRPRNTRRLPCFRLQVLRLHEKIYSHRSWPGNSGTSPFS